jgi:hypothetical protein
MARCTLAFFILEAPRSVNVSIHAVIYSASLTFPTKNQQHHKKSTSQVGNLASTSTSKQILNTVVDISSTD